MLLNQSNNFKRFFIGFIVLIAGLIFINFISTSILALEHPLQKDISEAVVVNQALRLAQGLEIYKTIDKPPYLQTCYTPFYLWTLSKVITDNPQKLFFPGRLISFLSSLALVIILCLIVFYFTRSLVACLISFSFYFASPIIWQWSYLARVDMYGILWMFLAIYLYIIFKNKNGLLKGIFILPLILGVYTKYSLVIVPLAIFTDILLSKDKKGMLWYCGFLMTIFALFVYFNIQTSGFFYKQLITYSMLPWDWTNFSGICKEFINYHILYIGLASVYFNRLLGISRKYRIITFCLSFSLIEFMMSGRTGANHNYLITLILVLTMMISITFAYLFKSNYLQTKEKSGADAWHKQFILFYFALLIVALCAAYLRTNVNTEDLRRSFREDIGDAKVVNTFIKSTKGKMLTEDGQWALLNGKEYYFDGFAMSMLSRSGIWDQSAVLNGINNKEFGVIVLSFDVTDGLRYWRFTDEMIQATAKHYQLRMKSKKNDLFVYVPLEIEMVPNKKARSARPLFVK